MREILIEAANTLEDLADAADMRGKVSGNRLGAINIHVDESKRMRALSNNLKQIMKDEWCSRVDFGSYDCYEGTGLGFAVDSCLVGEVNKLVNSGVKTIGCCCGHGKKQGYIQVAPESIDDMKKLGYEQLPIDEQGNGQWCFKPKTNIAVIHIIKTMHIKHAFGLED